MTFHQSLMVMAFVLVGSTAGAQISGVPGRDTPSAPQADTAAIKGRVVDGLTAKPLARARVQLHGPGGLRQTALTDESGSFAFSGLPAGLYSMNAEKSLYLPGRLPESKDTLRSDANLFFPVRDRQIVDGTMSLFRGGVISGRVVDSYADPVERAAVQVMRVSRTGGRLTVRGGGVTNDAGEFRMSRLEAGNYLLLVQPRPDVDEDGPPTQSLPTLYPGVLTRDQAVPIAVDRGGSVTGLEVPLVDGTISRVTGRLIESTGGRAATGGFVHVRAVVSGVPDQFDTATASAKPDGTFELRLAPGEYLIEGRAVRAGTAGPIQKDDEQIGMSRLTVTSGADSDVTVVLGPGATVAGRIVFAGRTTMPPDSSQIRVSFKSPDGAAGCRMGRSDLGANWTFSVDGLLGTCVAQVSSSVGLLTAKAVIANDVDLMDQPVTFQSGQQLRNVQVIVTDKLTDLTFHVTDANGTPTSNYVALVFSIDRSRWVDNSRYIRAFVPAPPFQQAFEPAEMAVPGSVPTTAARESVRGLPPGEYYVVALDDLEADAVTDPAVLDSLARAATRITLSETTPAEVSLRVLTPQRRSASR